MMETSSIDQNKLVWRRTPRSTADGACFEIAKLDNGGIAVRDSKQEGKGPILTYTLKEWQVFLADIKDGAFDDFAEIA